MKRFEREVTSAFRTVPQLRWAAAYSHRGFVPLVGTLPHGCYFYLFARDERSGSGPVRVDAWVAPPHPPDDGLDSLMVGYQIRVAESWDFSEGFLDGCTARTRQLLTGVDNLAAAVARELAEPAFVSKRLVSYRIERQLFNQVCDVTTESSMDDGQIVVTYIAKQVAAGKSAYSQLERECARTCKLLLSDGKLSRDLISFYDSDSNWMGESIAGHIYVEALTKHPGPPE